LAEILILMSLGCKHIACPCWKRWEQWGDWGSRWDSTCSCTVVACSSHRNCVWSACICPAKPIWSCNGAQPQWRFKM
jgi:hypothetical protein